MVDIERRGYLLVTRLTLPAMQRVGIALAVLGLAFGVAGCASDPWPGVVERVSDEAVCSRQFDDSRNPGGYTPCVPIEDVEIDVAEIEVGDCVALNIHHPTLVIEREIPCPQGEPFFPPATTTEQP